MRRRDFITILGGAAAAWPLAARAQRARKVPRIGILDFFASAASVDFLEPFRKALRELGHVEDQNILVDYHSAEQRSERAAAIAADLVRREVDIIVAVATPAAHAAKSATATIPIVMAVADPLATGLVASLARPGGNLTGVSSTSPDLAGKRLEVLRELRPGLGRVAFLGAANDPNTRNFVKETQAAADSLGVQLQPLLVTGPDEFEAAFVSMIKQGSGGLIVQPLFVGHRSKLAELAARHRLPMIADQTVFARAGGLVAYGVSRRVIFQRQAFYVDKILNETGRSSRRAAHEVRSSDQSKDCESTWHHHFTGRARHCRRGDASRARPMSSLAPLVRWRRPASTVAIEAKHRSSSDRCLWVQGTPAAPRPAESLHTPRPVRNMGCLESFKWNNASQSFPSQSYPEDEARQALNYLSPFSVPAFGPE